VALPSSTAVDDALSHERLLRFVVGSHSFIVVVLLALLMFVVDSLCHLEQSLAQVEDLKNDPCGTTDV